MSKEAPSRGKPPVNLVTVQSLQDLGLSAVGARQVLSGQITTSEQDRLVIAALLSEAVDQGGGGFTTKLRVRRDAEKGK